MTKKVLLVEDFPIIQSLYSGALENHGFEVDVVADGKDALVKVQSQVYDFVLIDLLLPKVNGVEFLEKFTNRPQQTKVIVLSDFNEPKTVEKTYKLGIAAYLIKAENTPSELIEKLNKLA